MKIGNWNVRTPYRSGNIAQAAREITRRGIDIMGISETHWTGQGTMQLPGGKTIIYCRRDDDNPREGVGILIAKHAAGSLMEPTRSTKGLFKPDSIPDTLNLRLSIYMHPLKMQMNR